MAEISQITLLDGVTYDLKDAVARQGLVQLTYGTSTWNDFLEAYNAHKIVYCENNGRMAFMAYISKTGTTLNNVEFQYYRSVSSKTDQQQGDQVFVYTLASTGAWSTTTREAYSKVIGGTNITTSYGAGAITINADEQRPEIVRFVGS